LGARSVALSDEEAIAGRCRPGRLNATAGGEDGDGQDQERDQATAHGNTSAPHTTWSGFRFPRSGSPGYLPAVTQPRGSGIQVARPRRPPWSGSLPPGKPDRADQTSEVITEADPERGRRSSVVADQCWAVRTTPGIPRPSNVGDHVSISATHVLVDVVVGAVILAKLAGHHRDLGRQGRDRRVPARRRARVEEVG